MPIGFKNGTGGSVQLAIDGMIACKENMHFLVLMMMENINSNNKRE